MYRWHFQRAVRVLNRGGVVMHATEGVWGLACDPHNATALARLLWLKGRAVEKGLIVIADDAKRFQPELASLDPRTRSTVEQSWPGAVTWVLPNRQFSFGVTGGRDTVAVRVPGHPQARELCHAFDGPLISTSANRAGRRAPTSALQARRSFPAHVFPTREDYVLPGEVLGPGAPSQIRIPGGATLRGGHDG